MEDTAVNTLLKAYFETYRRRNLETKGIDRSACEGGILWVWETFGECILCPAHKVGYLAGTLSLLFWTVDCLMTHTQIASVFCLWKLLVLSFIVNIVSFAGAVLTLQIMFVISYDLLTTIIMAVAVLSVSVMMLIGRAPGSHGDKLNCNKHEPVTPAPTQQRHKKVWSHKVLPLCLGIISLVCLVFVSVASIIILKEASPNKPRKPMGLQHPVPWSIVGYALGCIACFGRWWIDIFIMSRFPNDLRAITICKSGGFMGMISDILYITGVLLQSGSFQVTIVTLPWLVGRAVECSFHVVKLTTTKLLFLCPSQKCDDEDNEKARDEKINDLEVVSLLGSSESQERDMVVLFDRSWNVQKKSSLHSHPEESMASATTQSRVLHSNHAGTTTTDSDVSSTSQEQTLMWEDDLMALRTPAAIDIPITSRLRHQRLSLASQIETQSQTPFETRDQRIRSWISQSTPEEKVPPCLTLTLNWDSTLDSVNNNITEEMFGNKKFNIYEPLSLSARKKSF